MGRKWRQAAAVAVWLGLAAVAVPAGAEDAPPASQAALVKSLLPAVVNITARAEVPDEPAEGVQAATSLSSSSYKIRVNAGSGFIIDPNGLIGTNWHVVDGAFEIVVTFADGSTADATLVQAARSIDLALLKVAADHPLPAIRWGDSSKMEVGDPVLAIGNALGVGMSVSGGIISALNRNISDTPYDDFIQTDAAINHGNSGGPLFNLQGEVIGVNSALISPTSANAGLGFALPSNDAREVLDRLAHPGAYSRPAFLGVKVQAISREMAEALGLTGSATMIVAGVMPTGPADKAGLQAGDIIRTLDGRPIADDRALLRDVAVLKPGRTVTLGILRDDAAIDLPVTLGAWPQMMWERNAAPPSPVSHLRVAPDLGMQVATLTAPQATGSPIAPLVTGVLVTAVQSGTDAARRGLESGDLVLEVGRRKVVTDAEFRDAIAAARAAGRNYALLLVYPKKPPGGAQVPGPHWVAVRVSVD